MYQNSYAECNYHFCAGNMWRLWVTTGIEPNQNMTSSVQFVLYGDKGQSQPIILKDTDGLSCVQGATENFEVKYFTYFISLSAHSLMLLMSKQNFCC